jgi:hypothetical protein
VSVESGNKEDIKQLRTVDMVPTLGAISYNTRAIVTVCMVGWDKTNLAIFAVSRRASALVSSFAADLQS